MVRTLKIAYIIDMMYDDLAGTENQLLKMINGLSGRFQIQLIYFKDSDWLKKNTARLNCDSHVIAIHKFYKPSTFHSLVHLIRFLRNYRPDVVHTFFPLANILGILAARLAGIKNTISSRRDYGEWINGRYLLATGVANKFVKKIVANSSQVKELTKIKEMACDEKVMVIFNGIDTSVFKKVERDHGLKKKLEIPEEDKVVGIIANFRPMKHHYAFLKAAQEILKVRTDVSFVLIGGGELLQEVTAFAKSLNIGHKLYFTGPQRDVLPYLSIMDVGVNCSEREGLSNAVMEYMAVGVPCVVSDAGGNPDLITHDKNGYVFKLDDYKTLADLTLRLLEDEPCRQRLTKNAREKIEKEMSIEAMLSQYEGLYRSLAGMN